jgi:hypothetical protein
MSKSGRLLAYHTSISIFTSSRYGAGLGGSWARKASE